MNVWRSHWIPNHSKLCDGVGRDFDSFIMRPKFFRISDILCLTCSFWGTDEVNYSEVDFFVANIAVVVHIAVGHIFWR